MLRSRLLHFLALIHVIGLVRANNIQIANVQLVGQNTTTHTYQVQFDVSWENSWRTSTQAANYDAAWIFIKFTKLDLDIWSHAKLELSGSVAPGGSTVQVSANSDAPTVGVGAYIYRAADGAGSVNYTGMQLRWNYGLDGIADNDLVEVAVLGVEMVYVPQGSFYLGDGSGISSSFEDAVSGNQVLVTTDASALTLGGGAAGSIGDNNSTGQTTLDDFNDATAQALPAAFPLGYAPFYCMKYETSQGQYASFLTLLTSTQATARFMNVYGQNNNTIKQNGTRYEADVPSRVCNYLAWADMSAYLDWAGLRPMSETEFEKACRGTRYAVTREFAWGNASIGTYGYTNFANPNTDQTTITGLNTNLGNGNYSPYGVAPMRCGIFAASSANHTREETGASFYGIMELSGNIYESVVTLGNASGRAFDGRNGDGALTAAGAQNVTNWPSPGTATGSGQRGGSWNASSTEMRVSCRTTVNTIGATRTGDLGGRGVRTAP